MGLNDDVFLLYTSMQMGWTSGSGRVYLAEVGVVYFGMDEVWGLIRKRGKGLEE